MLSSTIFDNQFITSFRAQISVGDKGIALFDFSLCGTKSDAVVQIQQFNRQPSLLSVEQTRWRWVREPEVASAADSVASILLNKVLDSPTSEDQGWPTYNSGGTGDTHPPRSTITTNASSSCGADEKGKSHSRWRCR